VVEAIKLAEDGSGDVIVRMYEGTGGRANTEIFAKFEYQKVVVVDLLERTLEDQDLLTPLDSARLQVELRPFKIVTLRFMR